jgi:hypothetical protein
VEFVDADCHRRPVLTEAEPRHPDDPPAALQGVQAGYLHLEKAVTSIEWGAGLALRYGGFYGPGTSISLAPDAHGEAAPRRSALGFPQRIAASGPWQGRRPSESITPSRASPPPV